MQHFVSGNTPRADYGTETASTGSRIECENEDRIDDEEVTDDQIWAVIYFSFALAVAWTFILAKRKETRPRKDDEWT